MLEEVSKLLLRVYNRTFFSAEATSQLRSGWKVLSFFLLVIIIKIPFSIVLFQLAEMLALGSFAQDAVARASTLIAALIASYVCCKLLSGRDFVAYALHTGWWSDLLKGHILAIMMVGFVVAVSWVLGGYELGFNRTFNLAQIVTFWAFLLLAASLEEVLFRGYPLQEFGHSLGSIPAALLMSVPFALVHTANPCHTLLANLNTILAGLWLCAAYFRTRSLWLATGLHLGWNFALGPIFGINVSGIDTFTRGSLLATKESGHWLLTGGCYGLEGSLLAVFILIIGTFALSLLASPSPEMANYTRIDTV